MIEASSLLMLTTTAILNASGVIAIKRALNRCGPFPLIPPAAAIRYAVTMLRQPDALMGGLAFFMAPIAFVASLRNLDLVVAYPIFVGLNFTLLFVFGAMLLGEPWTVRKLCGTALILAGVATLQGVSI